MKHSILIVDDSASFHKLIRTYLANEPISIYSAYNGSDAIVEAERLAPGAIVLDLDMPGLNGFEVCRRLKGNALTRAIPILFLTADVSPSIRMKGLELGADGYLTKRFKPEELRMRVWRILRSMPTTDALAMIDDLTQLWNRTYRNLHLPAMLSLSRRTGKPLTCMMIDVDGLERINCRFGQLVGDDVLRSVAQVLASLARTEDMICYLERGRFSLLMQGTPLAGAAQLAERLRVEMELRLNVVNDVTIGATCRFGIADISTGEDSHVLDRAEAALAVAKDLGGNCVSGYLTTVMEECLAV